MKSDIEQRALNPKYRHNSKKGGEHFSQESSQRMEARSAMVSPVGVSNFNKCALK